MTIFLLVAGVAGADLTRPRELFLSGGGGAAGRRGRLGRGGGCSGRGYFLYWVSIFFCISLISSAGGAGLSGSSSPDILDWLLDTEAGSWAGGGGGGGRRSQGGSGGRSASSGGGGGRGGDRGGGAGLVRQLRMSERLLVMS